MADPASDADEPVAPQTAPLAGLDPELIDDVTAALQDRHRYEARMLVQRLDAAALADLLQLLAPELRGRLIEYLGTNFDPEVLPELEETVREDVVKEIGVATLAQAIARLESDDALLLIGSLTEETQRAVLQAIPAALRAMLEEGLTYPEESAGRLMQRDFVAVPAFWTVGETIDFARESER